MSDEQRYVVKLASGRWLNDDRVEVDAQRLAFKASRSEAYRIAAMYGAVALRLKPSARAAELAKLRAEVETLNHNAQATKILLAEYQADTVDAENRLDAMTKERDSMRLARDLAEQAVAMHKAFASDAIRERDALAAQLAALPPDISDAELAKCMGTGDGLAFCARTARRLLRGPVAPARPVEELRDELHLAWTNAAPAYPWMALAKRARELGAR